MLTLKFINNKILIILCSFGVVSRSNVVFWLLQEWCSKEQRTYNGVVLDGVVLRTKHYELQ
jgi:hypothetical protein